MNNNCNLKADWHLQVTCPMCSAKEVTSFIIMIADLWSFRLILYEIILTQVAARSVVELGLLEDVKSFDFQVLH